MPKVYLSGPMSGLPKYNYPAFYEAAMQLRLKGVEVLSPAEGAVTDDKCWSDYMRRAIKMLCDCDFNVRLPGWVNSTGARLETQIADALGIINIDLDEMLESLHPDGMEGQQMSDTTTPKAESEVARLTKMVDWLAEKQIRCAANGEQWYGPTIGKGLHVPMYPSKTEAINALVEAARRSVAAGEETCQK